MTHIIYIVYIPVSVDTVTAVVSMPEHTPLRIASCDVGGQSLVGRGVGVTLVRLESAI